jgi:Na+/H+ antiporter NhaD/arsenite permease-like protein
VYLPGFNKRDMDKNIQKYAKSVLQIFFLLWIGSFSVLAQGQVQTVVPGEVEAIDGTDLTPEQKENQIKAIEKAQDAPDQAAFNAQVSKEAQKEFVDEFANDPNDPNESNAHNAHNENYEQQGQNKSNAANIPASLAHSPAALNESNTTNSAVPGQDTASLGNHNAYSKWWAVPLLMVLLLVGYEYQIKGKEATARTSATNSANALFGQRYFGYILGACVFLTVGLFTAVQGVSGLFTQVLPVLFSQLLPYVAYCAAIFVIAQGVLCQGFVQNTLKANVWIFIIALFSAPLIGGVAAVLLLLPVSMSVNSWRQNPWYIVALLLLFGGMGAGLSPWGHWYANEATHLGVTYAWHLRHVSPFLLMALLLVLIGYYLGDRVVLQKKSAHGSAGMQAARNPLQVSGLGRLVYLIPVVVGYAMIHLPSLQKYSVSGYDVVLFHAGHIVSLACSGLVMWFASSKDTTISDGADQIAVSFSSFWKPVLVFLSMAIVSVPFLSWLAMERVSATGGTIPTWGVLGLSVVLSAVVDSSQLLLAFFHTTGADIQALMGPLHEYLRAAILGLVVFSGFTYLGSFVNLLVVSLAKEYDIVMPSLARYFLYISVILLPVILLLGFLVF